MDLAKKGTDSANQRIRTLRIRVRIYRRAWSSSPSAARAARCASTCALSGRRCASFAWSPFAVPLAPFVGALIAIFRTLSAVCSRPYRDFSYLLRSDRQHRHAMRVVRTAPVGPRLRRDRARSGHTGTMPWLTQFHICSGTGLTHFTSAPGLGLPAAHIYAGTGPHHDIPRRVRLSTLLSALREIR